MGGKFPEASLSSIALPCLLNIKNKMAACAITNRGGVICVAINIQ